jgi:hypothetical protein
MRIAVVENPRKKTRRYSAKQRAYGFGGGKKKARRKTTRRKRRNPGIMALGNPKRRTYRAPARRRSYRRRSNPSMFGGGMFSLINMQLALGFAGGMAVAHTAPGMLRRVWAGAPTTGFGGTAVRIGSAVLAGVVIKMVTRSKPIAVAVVSGAIGYEVFNMLKTYIPGLEESYVTPAEMNDLTGYVNDNPGIAGTGGYVDAMQTGGYGTNGEVFAS